MIGLDTGFFVSLAARGSSALDVWRRIVDGEEAAVSCLVLFELRRLALKGVLTKSDAATIVAGIEGCCTIAWIDNQALIDAASSLSHGLGIPSMDALILAGLLSAGATEVYTTDAHLLAYRKKGVAIKIVKPSA